MATGSPVQWFDVEGEKLMPRNVGFTSSCILSPPQNISIWPEQREEEAGRGSRLLLVSGCAFTTAQGLRKWRKDFVRVLGAPTKHWDFGISKQWHWRVLNKSDYNRGLGGKKKVTLSTSRKACIGVADRDSENASHFARVTEIRCKI